jgi:methyltransferase (TIGR00027 family)
MPELADSTVFEVDHASTQRYKRARLEGLEPKARDVRFVSVDFERDDLTERLEQAGHDASARTTWIWEGVTMYLTPPAIASTLSAIRARSAIGSTLVMTYGTPGDGEAGTNRGWIPRRVLVHWLALPFLRAIGEPMHGLMSVESVQRLLMTHGFEVKDDARCFELAKRMGLPRPHAVVGERLAVAIAVCLPGA